MKSGSGEDIEATTDAANGATKTGGKVTFCKTEDLAIDARDAAPDEDSLRIDITMVNRGSTTCSATGVAGVDIKDADNTSNPIERGQAQPRNTTLKPGDAAAFNLAYDIDNTGDSLAHPTNFQVTHPNETHTVSLKWPAAAGEIKRAYTDVQVYPRTRPSRGGARRPALMAKRRARPGSWPSVCSQSAPVTLGMPISQQVPNRRQWGCSQYAGAPRPPAPGW